MSSPEMSSNGSPTKRKKSCYPFGSRILPKRKCTPNRALPATPTSIITTERARSITPVSGWDDEEDIDLPFPSGTRPAILLKVEDIDIPAFIDTGAGNTIAGYDLYRALKTKGISGSPINLVVTLADGKGRRMQAEAVKVKVQMQSRIFFQTFLAFKNERKSQTLLGSDFIKNAHMVLNLSRLEYCIDDGEIMVPKKITEVPSGEEDLLMITFPRDDEQVAKILPYEKKRNTIMNRICPCASRILPRRRCTPSRRDPVLVSNQGDSAPEEVRPGTRPLIRIKVEGIRVSAFIDTGSGSTIAGYHLYRILKAKGISGPTVNLVVTFADGQDRKMKVEVLDVNVKIENKTFVHKFLAFKNEITAETLLGSDFIKAARMVLYLARGEYFFDDDGKRQIRNITEISSDEESHYTITLPSTGRSVPISLILHPMGEKENTFVLQRCLLFGKRILLKRKYSSRSLDSGSAWSALLGEGSNSENSEERSDQDDINYSFQLGTRSAIWINVEGIDIAGIIDTGLCNSIAGDELYEAIKAKGFCGVNVCLPVNFADGKKKRLQAEAYNLKVVVNGRMLYHTFLVIENEQSSQTILGSDFIKNARILLNLAEKEVYFEEEGTCGQKPERRGLKSIRSERKIQKVGCPFPRRILPRRKCSSGREHPRTSNSPLPLASSTSINFQPGFKPGIIINIEGKDFPAFLDTGVSNSLASLDLYKYLRTKGISGPNTSISIALADGKERKVLAEAFNLKVILNNRPFNQNFIVFKNVLRSHIILGFDFIENSQMMLNLSKKEYCFNHEGNPRKGKIIEVPSGEEHGFTGK